jgi:hypothetical protein
VLYTPEKVARELFGCDVGRRERQCGIFFNVAEGAGLLRRQYAGLDSRGQPRKRSAFAFSARVVVPVVDYACDWLPFGQTRCCVLQQITRAVMHYIYTRPRCTWVKVIEDISGHYDGCFSKRRLYDVVNVLKALLRAFGDSAVQWPA